MPNAGEFSGGYHQRITVSIGEVFQALSAMAAERYPGVSGQVNNNWNYHKEALRRLIDSIDGTAVSSAAGIAELAKYNVTTTDLRARLAGIGDSNEFH